MTPPNTSSDTPGQDANAEADTGIGALVVRLAGELGADGDTLATVAALYVEAQARAPEITGAFTGAKEKGARQAELEQQWAAFAKANFEQARAKADQAAKLAR